MAGDILRGMRGDINCTEQARLLQGLDMLIQIIGAPIYSVAPQVSWIPPDSDIWLKVPCADHGYSPVWLQGPSTEDGDSIVVATLYVNPDHGGCLPTLSTNNGHIDPSLAHHGF